MNPITKALSDVKFRIPKPILRDAFIPKTGYFGSLRNDATSLDRRIRSQVIDARVVPDCNLVGGNTSIIFIGDIKPRSFDDWKVIWQIPFERTNNREIIRVHHLIYGTYSMHGSSTPNRMVNETSALGTAVNNLLSTNRNLPDTTESEIELVGENTVMGFKQVVPSSQLYLRCVIENESEMNNLPNSAIVHFSKLVEYAVKSYIYNTLILEVDQGRLSGGSELGRYTTIIEQYSDAEENYHDYFQNRWRKVAFFSDPEAKRRHIKRIVGGGV